MNVLEREQCIQSLAAEIEACQDRDEQRRIFAQMAELIRGRSQEVVAQMEHDKRLTVSQDTYAKAC